MIIRACRPPKGGKMLLLMFGAYELFTLPQRDMLMSKKLVVLLTAVFVCLSGSCAEKAKGEEIAQMCDRLLELRGKVGDEAMKAACVKEAIEEGISKRQALCRISAINTQEYWNRCRTGEPRPQ